MGQQKYHEQIVQDELQYPQTMLVFYYGFGYKEFSMEELNLKCTLVTNG